MRTFFKARHILQVAAFSIESGQRHDSIVIIMVESSHCLSRYNDPSIGRRDASVDHDKTELCISRLEERARIKVASETPLVFFFFFLS